MHQSTQAPSLKTAAYLLRFTPDEKAALEQKCRLLAARSGRSVTLADALRHGVTNYLDELLGEGKPAVARRLAR
jgi:hypothetical protein